MRVIEGSIEPVTNVEMLLLLKANPLASQSLAEVGKLKKDEIRVMTSIGNTICHLENDTYTTSWVSAEIQKECLQALQGQFDLAQLDLLQIANVAPRNLVQLCSCIESHGDRFTEEELDQMLQACQACYFHDRNEDMGAKEG